MRMGVVSALALAGALWLRAADERPSAAVDATSAYCENRVVDFAIEPAAHPDGLSFGPWRYGERLAETKPNDRRPNLYMVAPGKLLHSDTSAEYDHSLVIAAVPAGAAAKEWDVYWAIVLDPSLRHDFRSERELLVAAHAGFDEGDLYELADAPGHTLLGPAGIRSTRALERFRRHDGKLPRLVLVPAGFAIRATATEPATAAKK